MRGMRRAALAALALFTGACSSGTRSAEQDPFLWLEAVASPEASRWVADENRKTMAALGEDPRYAENLAKATALGESPQRLARPQIVGDSVFNFWQDKDHTRGIWRQTSVGGYETGEPHWTTVLDLDRVAEAEGKNWVWKGADCSLAAPNRCLVELSEGGEDAVTVREFDTRTRSFVPDGFALPRGKQDAQWLDEDTLLVSREWRPGELTSSGYPYIVKTLRRGQTLDSAAEIGRGQQSDMQESAAVLHDGDGGAVALLVRNPSFFESEYRLVAQDGTPKLALPPKSSLAGLVAGRLVVRLDQDWAVAGSTFASGSLVSLRLADLTADPAGLRPTLVWAPGPRDALHGVAVTRGGLIVSTLHEVSGRIAEYLPAADGSWSSKDVPIPELASADLLSAAPNSATAYFSVGSFLAPTTVWRMDAAAGTARPVVSLPPQFDATGLMAEQLEATSKDGTKVPYFVVRRNDIPFDGSNPTILYAYGGFGNSMTPSYSGVRGQLWLERGGVFVLANIRGGGEFGPAWHDAALKTNRQRAYDDFAAVGEDLVARKITSPRRLGIQGASNGGLLMGVELVQRPQLWNAVDIGVPLLDMLRYEQIDAGASWAGEYGSARVPEERAFLESVSPYQNLKRGVRYPAPFIWTTTKDDRVGPQHARKFAAKLASFGDPYFFYEVTEGGHGSGANIAQSAVTTALEYTYFQRQLM
ncbi:prolyl oligopeptidase family serine peptidase [Segniliparus rugosus]|nr:prolyl oligopeptidase family serine peptidase [Segniliparus rugosus]